MKEVHRRMADIRRRRISTLSFYIPVLLLGVGTLVVGLRWDEMWMVCMGLVILAIQVQQVALRRFHTIVSEKLLLVDRHGQMRVCMKVEKDGNLTVHFHDPEGRPRAGLVVMPDGQTLACITDADGNLLSRAP